MNILRKTAICGAIMLSAACVCPLHAEEAQPLKYVDALNFRMINKGFADTETPFTRLPKYLKDFLTLLFPLSLLAWPLARF